MNFKSIRWSLGVLTLLGSLAFAQDHTKGPKDDVGFGQGCNPLAGEADAAEFDRAFSKFQNQAHLKKLADDDISGYIQRVNKFVKTQPKLSSAAWAAMSNNMGFLYFSPLSSSDQNLIGEIQKIADAKLKGTAHAREAKIKAIISK